MGLHVIEEGERSLQCSRREMSIKARKEYMQRLRILASMSSSWWLS